MCDFFYHNASAYIYDYSGKLNLLNYAVLVLYFVIRANYLAITLVLQEYLVETNS